MSGINFSLNLERVGGDHIFIYKVLGVIGMVVLYLGNVELWGRARSLPSRSEIKMYLPTVCRSMNPRYFRGFWMLGSVE